ncbi:hypothetical protein RRG08_011021 [Elysia crispata]|uniref:Uncharacterized protein n=1 Tax=Elysia crispata TaxID=231223 RepID=A0AAE1CWJ8_9GAST|nr:hypothetical protein RRG08_011021 [Elysia crispata]
MPLHYASPPTSSMRVTQGRLFTLHVVLQTSIERAVCVEISSPDLTRFAGGRSSAQPSLAKTLPEPGLGRNLRVI